MEFFGEIEARHIDTNHLKNILTISTLPEYCSSIDTVIIEQNNDGEIYCLWGQFNIRREAIKHGVRFSLLNCPHALSWTITHHEKSQQIVIHCTIDKKQEDEDFIESIHQFVSDWATGLSNVSP
jgi:hypothetical protein